MFSMKGRGDKWFYFHVDIYVLTRRPSLINPFLLALLIPFRNVSPLSLVADLLRDSNNTSESVSLSDIVFLPDATGIYNRHY